jgi:hypothetical protein
VITASLLHIAGVTVTGADIDELDTALTTGPRHGRQLVRLPARYPTVPGGATCSGFQVPLPLAAQ